MINHTAREIAELARLPTTTVEEAAGLIQSFANVAAAEAARSALEATHARTMAILEAPLLRRSPDAQT